MSGNTETIAVTSKRVTIRTREEMIVRVVSIENWEPPKPRIRSTRIKVQSAKCTVENKNINWRIHQQQPAVQLLVNFKKSENITQTRRGTHLKGLHFVGQSITLTALESPIVLSPH